LGITAAEMKFFSTTEKTTLFENKRDQTIFTELKETAVFLKINKFKT
jgi:hypothetical protein